MIDEKLKFPEVKWQLSREDTAVGWLFDIKMTIEFWSNPDKPLWTLIINNSNYGYQRGGRDGERTLGDIKKIAEEDMQALYTIRYENALDKLAQVQREQETLK